MSRLVWDLEGADPRGSERLGEREDRGARGNSGLSRVSGANPDAAVVSNTNNYVNAEADTKATQHTPKLKNKK